MAQQTRLEKVIAGLKTGPKFLKEFREFDNLVKAIGECKSKAEEDRIISQELEVLKQRLSDPKLDKSRGKEYMIRLIYCEMLGHDASFSYVKALQFASDPNIYTKKAAYLALTQFLDCNNQLVLLLVNTLLSDMKSDNYLVVCTALVATTKLIGADLVNAVYPVVVERLRHPKEAVRKKAVLALHWFSSLDPRREGPLAGMELDKHFRTMLCDKDPSVMSAALCALHDCVKADPRPYKNLIPSFTSILKQVSEHRLPKSYDYHRFPAPFIQIKLLKILALLGAGDRGSSENMAAVLHQTLRRANTSHTIGSAIIYECVRTITTIYPNPPLLAAAAESISAFLRSPSHNLRYVGIDALAGITALNPAAAAEHQVAVLDCLEDPDDTLKLKTLELLYKMTKANNIQVIVEKMMSYLASCPDEHIRRDIVRKVSDLAERYAPSPSWFVSTISEVFRLGGEHVDDGAAHRLTGLIAEQDEALHASAVEAYLALLDGEGGGAGQAQGQAHKKLPETILLVICWVLGEYGHLARRPPAAVLSRLLGVLTAHKAATDRVRATLLTALTKLAAHTGGPGGPVGTALLAPHSAGGEAAAFVHACLSSQNLELQQRAHELQALLSCPPPVLAAALPADASRRSALSPSELAEAGSLAFLDAMVERALAAGAAPYLPPEARGGKAAEAQAKGLRFEAYEPAPFAVPLAAASTSHPSSAGAADARSGPSTSAQSSGAATAGPATSSAPAEPQLLLKGAGGRKWGPAQYEAEAAQGPSTSGYSATSAGQPPAASAASSSSSTAAAAPRSGHHSRTPSGATLERERLAASLFGGGAGGGAAAAGPAPGRQPAQAPQQPALHKQPNGAAAAQKRAPAAAASNPMDLLLDLDVPQSQPHAAAAGAGAGPSSGYARPPHTGPAAGPGPSGDWMDSLLGGGPSPAMPGPGMGPGGGMGPSTGPQGSLLGGMANGGMMPGGMGGYGMPVQPALYGGVAPSGAGMGIGMAAGGVGGLAGPGYAAPPGMQQPWQAQAQQLGMGGGRPNVAPPPAHPGRPAAAGADPFGDLLG